MSWFRRGGRSAEAVVPTELLVAGSLGEWAHLDGEERARLVADVETLLRTKHWEAARGFELTRAMRVTIAAHAALVTLGLGVEAYLHVKAIIVHPTTIVVRTPRPGPVPGTLDDSPVELLGEAHARQGPVLLAWDAVRREARWGARSGRNVVVHEFAHKLDLLDGMIDGTPPLADNAARARWAEVSTREYRPLRAGLPDPVLRDYGGTDPGEFFAVAAEVFFTRPVELQAEKPELYSLYRDYFGQDPAARRSRSPVS